MQHLEHPDVIGELPYSFADMFQQVFSVVMEGSLSDEGRVRFRSSSLSFISWIKYIGE